MKNSAKQFYLRRTGGLYVLSGYPWGVVLARNTFMAAPGITLAIDHENDFHEIMATALSALNRFMDSGVEDDTIAGISLPDIPLWAVWAIQQYGKLYPEDCPARYGEDVRRIVDYILDNRHPNLHFNDADGMVTTDGADTPVSWMNGVVDGRPVNPRTGYLVEFDALWYNALRYALAITPDDDANAERRQRWSDAAALMDSTFPSKFLNEWGYMYDYVNGNYADPSVRPNMAVAIGLEYSPLSRNSVRTCLMW